MEAAIGSLGAAEVAPATNGPSHRGALRRSSQRNRTFKKSVAWLYKKAKRPAAGTGSIHVDISFVLLAAVVYGVLYFGLGSAFLPGHAAWDTLLLWASSLVGALVAYYLYMPSVIGMLVAGIMLRNIPWNAINAFPFKWGSQMRAAALATIFLRCGLELDFGTMRRYKGPATRLALVPGLAEAFYDGGIASVVFGMPVMLGFSLGFILKAVGPGLVVPAMFKLQKAGLGKDQGIPSTVVIAASFDDIVAITGFSIFSHIAIKSDGNTAWEIAEGPLQVLFGIAGGIIAGVALGCTKVFDTKLKRLVGTYGSCLLLMFFLGHFDMKAGGALGALVVGLIASNAWEKGFPRFASLGPSFEYSPAIERWMNVVWVWIMEPMLFVTIGASIDFDTLEGGTIPRALIVICSGLAVRLVCTYLVMGGLGYNWKEKIFYAVAWTPKATVQAALSATPLAMIESMMSPNDPDYEDWIKWGNDVLTTGIFAIIVCGTLGVLAIHFTSRLLLEQAEGSDAEEVETPPAEARKSTEPTLPVRTSVDATGPAVAREGMPRVASAHMRRPSSAQSHADMHVVTEDDYELIAEYIDAIRHLTVAAKADKPDKEEIQRLSDMVMLIQERIETEVGRREPSVREMFRTASFIAAQRPLRHRHGQAATGKAGSNASGSTASGAAQHHAVQLTGRGRDLAASASHHSRPGSPMDQV